MAMARELAYFYAPGVNSYKRYQAGSFAPTRIAVGWDNRTCGFRLCGEGGAFRVENRIPGADANPYLAFAATIAAGLHGIASSPMASRSVLGTCGSVASWYALPSDRKSTRLNSSHITISYAVFCLKKKKQDIAREIEKKRKKRLDMLNIKALDAIAWAHFP